jgi:hypothetical protein
MAFGTITFGFLPTMPCTIRTYKDNGPYFGATVMQYQASCLRDLLFHCRLAMEDGEDIISVWHDDRCTGLWEAEAEPEPDGEGGWDMPAPCYILRRPGGPMAGHFNALAVLCGGKG